MMKQIYSICFLLWTTTTFGFIYQIHVLRKWNNERRRYQHIIGLGDWHDKIDVATGRQRAYLEQLLPRCNTATTKVIVEDLSTDSAGAQARCGSFAVDTRGGLLGGLAQDCLACGLAVDNVEYRYCRVASVGPLLRASNIDATIHKATNMVKVGDIAQEVHDVMKQFQATNNGALNSWTNTIMGNAVKKMEKLHLDRHESQSMKHYVQEHCQDANRSQLLTSLLVFDSELMDAKIVNSIIRSPEKDTILAIAGGTHTAQVAHFLQKIGYELVYESRINYMKEYDLTRCVGTNIEAGKFCTRPCPVPIDLIKRYIQ